MRLAELSPRDERFIQEYLGSQNAKQAALAAGVPPKSASVWACRKLKEPHVIEALKHAQARLADKLEISRERISNVLAGIAFCGGEMLAKNGRTRIKVSTKEIRNAAMDLARLHGFIIERRDVRVIRGIEDLSDDELIAIAKGDDGHVTRH